jgi:hypothetical protein
MWMTGAARAQGARYAGDDDRPLRGGRPVAASTVAEGLAACRMLDELMMGGLAGCFARVEPRRQARKYVIGLISELPRKNCWALAEQSRARSPRTCWRRGAARRG